MKKLENEELELDLLLLALYRLSGFDFRMYMRSSLLRRAQHRMNMEKLPTITSLTEKAIHDPNVLAKILGDFSINVTEMFRDPSFFKALREKVIPLLKDLPDLRVWHAGCSTGEEVYSMAILLREEGLLERTKIYATDMNEKVLKQAESGVIRLQKMQSYTKNYLAAGGKRSFSEYYTTDSDWAYIDPTLKTNMFFAQHNLVTDGSLNEFHVIICRNVLIYFNSELQQQVLNLFNESLSVGGFLGLGSKESIRSGPDSVEEFDSLEKIYRKMAGSR